MSRMENIEKKILPIATDLDIVTYNHHIFTLSVLFLNQEFKEEYYNHFINLWFKENYYTELDFTTNFITTLDYFDNYKLNFANGKNISNEYKKQIESLIILSIQNGYYVTGLLNEYYLPDSRWYKVNYYCHNYLVYGFNQADRTIQIYGYNNSNKCVGRAIKYEDFLNCIFELGGMDNNIRFYKNKPQNEYFLDVKNICRELQSYLTARSNDDFNNTSDVCFGINVYSCVKRQILNSSHKIDMRTIRILLEHKNCMLKRLEYLYEKRIIKKSSIVYRFQSVQAHFETVFNLSLKRNLLHKRKEYNVICGLCSRICDIIDIAINEEILILTEVHKGLEEYLTSNDN